METAILTAIISGASAAISAIIVAAIQHRKTVAIIEYRLGELESKVDEHNKIVTRTYELEKTAGIMDTRLKALESKG